MIYRGFKNDSQTFTKVFGIPSEHSAAELKLLIPTPKTMVEKQSIKVLNINHINNIKAT